MASISTIPALRYTAETAEESRADMVARIPTITTRWTDHNDADIGMAIYSACAGLLETMIFKLDMRASETSAIHVRERKNAVRLFRLIGYQFQRKVASKTTLRFVLSAPATVPVIIAPYSQDNSTEVRTRSIQSISFVTKDLAIIPVGAQEVSVTALQGKKGTESFVADGTPSQVLELSTRNAAEGTILVKVNNVYYDTVSNFVFSNEKSFHIQETTDENGVIRLTFGDGVSGRIPEAGSQIDVLYVNTDGEQGSVFGKDRITVIATTVEDANGDPINGQGGRPSIVVTNTEDADGGEDDETLWHAKKQAPREYAAQQRAVTKADFTAWSEGFPGIRQAACVDINDFGVTSFIIDYYQIRIPVIPTTGIYPTAALKKSLQDYLDSLKAVPDDVEVIDPVYVPVDVSVDIYVKKRYTENVVKSNVQTAIQNFFKAAESPTAELAIGNEVEGMMFGAPVKFSQLLTAIQTVPGVASIASIVPNDDIDIGPVEIATLSSGSPVVNVLGSV